MFDPAACGSLRLMAVPTVDCDALLAVQAVLRTARGSATDDEKDARHSSVVDTGGADAAVCEPYATSATQSVSDTPRASVISEPPAGHASEDDRVAGPVRPTGFIRTASAQVLIRTIVAVRMKPYLLGFVPFDGVGGELLFNLITDRYERRATVMTTNLAFAEWVTVFAGDEKLTTALLDRLAHHATVITTKGKSYRMRKRRGHDSTA
jgi:hypothetical protein